MSELAVIIDLDKTVFKTGQFVSDLAQALETGFGINAKWFCDQISDAHIQGAGNLRHYDFFDQIQSFGLNADEVEAYILEALGSRKYTYDDVEPFLDFLAKDVQPDQSILLTYGETRFQRLKYKCAPVLGTLAIADTLRPKGPYIAERFPGYQGVIIDDKAVKNLPDNFSHIWLMRNGIPSAGESYGSLTTLQEEWERVVS